MNIYEAAVTTAALIAIGYLIGYVVGLLWLVYILTTGHT